jgi:hypothetical protein
VDVGVEVKVFAKILPRKSAKDAKKERAMKDIMVRKCALNQVGEANRPGGLTGPDLLLFASFALFRGLFHPGL